MTEFLILAVVLIAVGALAIAFGDTLRFVRRTGSQLPTALTYRSYLA